MRKCRLVEMGGGGQIIFASEMSETRFSVIYRCFGHFQFLVHGEENIFERVAKGQTFSDTTSGGGGLDFSSIFGVP